MPLKWMGKQVEAEVVARLSAGLVDIALDVEGEAKKELHKGHGVLTGTLRRSIHAASPDYNWQGDDTLPGPGTAERGGARIEPVRKGDLLLVAIGSGLEYAMAVHQGHGSFDGYHYLTNGLEKVKPRAGDHIRRHAGG